VVPTVVAGPLCESGDVFTQGDGGVVLTRDLPEARVGDLLAFHDAGAYGASMSSTYNSRPLAAEVLVDGDQARLVRRRQRIEELLALEVDAG
jgi:diaminopimelate decarboxylase